MIFLLRMSKDSKWAFPCDVTMIWDGLSEFSEREMLGKKIGLKRSVNGLRSGYITV